MTNDTAEKTTPRASSGTSSCRGGTPEAAKASVSLSEARRPMAIRAPTSEPKGNDIMTTHGSE